MNIILLKNENFIYKVKNGQTLKDVCNLFKISKSQLINDNNLTTEELSEGDCLFIREENKMQYVVKPAENIYDISKKLNVSVNYILQKNNLKSKHLFIGQILYI